MRALLLSIAAFLLLLVVAAGARAEEVFVLDNGAVLRGYVVREDPSSIVVRLSGFPGDARVTVDPDRIVRRFATVARPTSTPEEASPFADWSASARTTEESERPWIRGSGPLFDLPTEEPSVRAEGFFERLARVAVLAVPKDGSGRMLLGLLILVALLVLVALGGRVAEVEGMGLPHATILAALLGGILAANLYLHEELLRADRAIWVLPLQGLLWLGAAWITVRGGFQKSVLLFAFVLFSLAVVVFTAGAILVSF